MNEAAVDDHILKAASTDGNYLWRNNVGAFIDDRGIPVRFGLGNDSAKLNEVLKSSDRIGPTTIEITPEMVGMKIAVFTAIEVKKSDWVFRPSDKHAVAQARFHDIVRRAGGFAGFARSVQEYYDIIAFKVFK